MIPEKLVMQLSADVRGIYEADPDNAHRRIESMLTSRLSDFPLHESRVAMQKLIEHFRLPQTENATMESEVMTRVFSLLLGRKVAQDDLTSAELLGRLAQSLNTIFDALNKLISVINMSFSDEDTGEDQTIRQFIGFHLEGEDQTQSLEDYLGQISQAFLNTHEAFKKAAHKQVQRILLALDMEQVEKARSSGLKIGPLRKAEDYQILKEKIDRIRKWFESGRSTEDLLREFEKNCQTLTRR
jgi:hypothetical protein